MSVARTLRRLDHPVRIEGSRTALSPRELALNPDRPPYPSQARVLIVERDTRVRTGLVALLTDDNGLAVVGACGEASRAIQLVARLVPDVVLLEPLLPEPETGLRLLRQLRGRGLAVVVLSARDELRVPALRAGADAFVAKGEQPDAIVAALRSVLASGRSTPPR